MFTNTATLFVAFNASGDVAADQDRDVAIARLREDFGGDHFRVIEMTLTLPTPVDMQATATIPADKSETVEVNT